MTSPSDGLQPPLPPLPPGPPPPNTSMAHGYYAPAQGYSGQWDGMGAYNMGCPVTAFDAQAVPQITQLLYREGEAWRALLSLHAGVVSTAQQISAAVADATSLDTNETGNATEQRELQYCAALTHVAAQCDAMHTEAIKLRGLRKARASADAQAIQALMDAHTNETLAVGASLASNVSMSVQTATSDVRNAIQATRSQLAQTRALLQMIYDAPALRGRILIGITSDDDRPPSEFSPDAVFAAVYRRDSELTEESLAQAIEDLVLEHPLESEGMAVPVEEAVAPPPQRTVPRRTGDRTQGSHR